MFYDIDTTTVTMKNRKLADRKLADRMFPDWRCSGLILFLYFVIWWHFCNRLDWSLHRRRLHWFHSTKRYTI